MSRLEIVVVVVVALLWPSASIARLSLQGHEDVAHSILHWQGESHHHHDDGTFHVDESSESTSHLAADQLTATPALPVSYPAVSGFAASESPSASAGAPPTDPFLDGLLRPPRPTS